MKIPIHYVFNFNVAGRKSEKSDYESKSFIWKYDKKSKKFQEYQKITTTGAWDWTHFKLSSDKGELFHFLVSSK